MIIPEKILEMWQLLKSEGDPINIAKASKMHPHTIRDALREGVCGDNTFAAIAEFYDAKLKLIERYMPKPITI